ncbi:MAG TPA: FixH family protein [Chitinophaga sp.]
MNWGNGLTIAFCGFALLIGTLVYKSTHTKFDLVSEQYYDDEIHFQQQIEGARNAAKRTPVAVSQDDRFITLQFPDSLRPSGQAWFYYPTDAQHDRHFALQTNNGLQRIAKAQLQKGHCWIKLRWQADAVNYYTEQEMKIN